MKTHPSVLAPLIAFTALFPWSSIQAHGFDVLVFTKTSGFTHDSIPTAVTALTELGAAHDFGVTQTDDATTFINELENHHVVVFLNTTGDILDDNQQAAFKTWYRGGRGFVGLHAATDTEHGWPWYLEMVGAEVSNHGAIQTGTVEFLDQVHPITNVIDSSTGVRAIEWSVNEEWYNFTTSPRGKVHVLAHLDESTVTGGTHGDDHPIMWCQEFDGGRSAYLGPGHVSATYSDPIFRDLIVNSIEWAASELGGDSGATIEGNFEKVVLDSSVSSPMSLDVAPDGKIYFVERKGAVKVHDESTGLTTTIATLGAYSGGEYGVLGIALAPDFAETENLYILWSPNPSNASDTRLSRYTLDSSGNLDLNSEEVILEYLTNRPDQTGAAGHHQAGCLRFDPSGNLFITIGDNTQASPYSPRFDDQLGRDARKASPNTNDLRGKIIRITPNVGGGPAEHPNYTIPAGNLFAPGTALAREEIYVMGCRNCFRMCVDPVTGWIYYGDVGPDAGGDGGSAFQGPRGHDEFNQVKAAGWFGWPYYIADNKAYLDGSANDWTIGNVRSDLANYFTLPSFTGSGALAGDPNLLSDPQPAWIWYPSGNGNAPPQFSEVNGDGGRCAMAGAVYGYTPGNNFPAYYDRSVFLMEWSRNEIYEVKTRPDGSILEITEFVPHISFQRPIEMRFGPDGTMYMIEWGANFGSGSSDGTALVKVQYTKAAATPIAVANADVTSGGTPLTVNFSSAGSYDPDGGTLAFAWDFDGDQEIDSTEANPTHEYTVAGTYTAQLTVTDNDLLFSRKNVTISVGNFAPELSFDYPHSYAFFDWGDTIAFQFGVSDVEDGSTSGGEITAGDVVFEASLGHDDHQHNEVQLNALAGSVEVPRDDSHPFDLDIGYVFDAFYTDQGAPGVDPIQSSAKVVLQPKVTMAQTYDGQSGVQVATTLDPVGGALDVTDIDHGDYLYFRNLNLNSIGTIRLRAAAAGGGGTVEIRQDSPSGNLVATVNVTSTGSWTDYQDFGSPVSGALTGSHDLYFVFRDVPSATDLLRLNWISFRGSGATLVANRPVLHEARVVATGTLLLEFDQIMDHASLSNPANYSIDGGASIISATPFNDQLGVSLSLSGVSEGNYYTVSFNGLEDLAGDSMNPGESTTIYYLLPSDPTFLLGLNCGGGNFTDAAGNLYLDDTAPASGTGTGATLLVDFNGNNGTAVAATPSDFATADPDVSLGATVNVLSNSAANAVALQASGINGVTLTNSGSANSYNTNKGSYDGTVLLDGYFYETASFGAAGDSETTIAGLGEIATGSTVRLTLWGVGDTSNSDTTFELVYNGATVGTQTTDYDTGDPADASVQFSFTKVASADSLTINWGKGSTDTCGFNALSLTVAGSTYLVTPNTRTFTTGDDIDNTTDDPLYKSERWHNANFAYAIPVENGSYDVLLRFAEIYQTSNGNRTLNVQIESVGSVFNPDLDIHSMAGHDAAVDFTIDQVLVTDGVLNIEFIDTGNDNPKASAIGIFERSDPGTSVPDPSFAAYLNENPESRYSITSDIDGDGIVTLLEYAFGGNDNQADLEILPSLGVSESGDYHFLFTRPENLPDLTYVVEASDQLDIWVPITPTITTNSLGDGTEEVRYEGLRAAATAAGLGGETGCFFRTSVTLTSP